MGSNTLTIIQPTTVLGSSLAWFKIFYIVFYFDSFFRSSLSKHDEHDQAKKLFQNSTWKKWELLKAILVQMIGWVASALWLTLGHQDSAKPCAASVAWNYLISGGSYDFHHLLDPNQNLLQHKHLETLLHQTYLSDFKNVVEEGEKYKCVQPSYAFYRISSYIKIRRHFHFSWLFISLGHSVEIF